MVDAYANGEERLEPETETAAAEAAKEKKREENGRKKRGVTRKMH